MSREAGVGPPKFHGVERGGSVDSSRRLLRGGSPRSNPEREVSAEEGSLSAVARVRNVIARVPRGKVMTYGQAAAIAGFPGGARLTVWALQRGEDLPWHRVVAAGGRIALPGVEGQEQRLRLKMEGVTFRGGRVRMDVHEWIPRRRAGHRGRRRVESPQRPPELPADEASTRWKTNRGWLPERE